MAVQSDPRRFGVELKRWRTQRRFSRHELAVRSESSQRHLSYLENGRSRPSPEMIEHLSIALDVPLRARNSLFVAARFAPAHSEEPLKTERLTDLRRSLRRLVDAHQPFPLCRRSLLEPAAQQ
ncbi:MAG: helix-turn-helix transcriptional regulator [Ilumatobacteraceae bacterium]|nr:helix-turn-helix transcriptional regulator [Ilumatobacteraceae bacterium]